MDSILIGINTMGMRTPLIYIANDGAICTKLLAVSASVRGKIVCVSTSTAGAASYAAADDNMPIGTYWSSGTTAGSLAWVAVSGRAPVYADAGGITQGQWVGTGGTATVADGDTTPGVVQEHMQELGHAVSAITAGVVGTIIMHLN